MRACLSLFVPGMCAPLQRSGAASSIEPGTRNSSLSQGCTMQPQQRVHDANRRRAAPRSAFQAASAFTFTSLTAAMVLCCCLPACSAFSFSSPFKPPPARPSRSSSSSSSRRASMLMSVPRRGIGNASGYGHEHHDVASSARQARAPLTAMTAAAARVASRGRTRTRTRTRARAMGMRMMMSSDSGSGGGEEENDEDAEARAEREFESIFDKNSAILDVPLETFDESNVEPLMPGSVRTEMPVFMLDLSACPGGVVPLHIFEMRYRQMFNDIGTTDNRFGMLVTDPTTRKPCKYGAVMECAQRKLLPDGRQYVLNQAVERFRVLKVLKSTPYTVMEVEVGIPDSKPFDGEPARWGADEGTRLEDLELEVYSTVNSVVELMNKLAPPATPGENRTLSEWFLRYSPKVKRDEGLEGESAGDELAQQAKEDERRMKFSFAVAEMIAMESQTKQLLLQSRSTAYRLMAVREILVKAQKELAAKSSLKDTLG